MYIQEYDDAENVSKNKRSVYIIVFWDGNHIRERIQKICDSFSGQRYELPDLREIGAQIENVKKSIEDARNVYIRTKQSLRDQLIQFDKIEGDGDDPSRKTSSTIYIFKMFLAKEKALYQTLNMMKWQNQTFIGYFWAPNEQEIRIKNAIAPFSAAKVMAYDNHDIPRPTYFKTNEFTYIWQLIVDTYGVPTYLEANPVPVSIVTFPFFFGMMYGDMGHGSIVLMIGIVLCLFNDQLKNTFVGVASPVRYIFLLMGFFATYCGFIYNEFFAINLNIFPSCYNLEKQGVLGPNGPEATLVDDQTEGSEPNVTGDCFYPKIDYDCNYMFGQDPVWGLASNKLTFTNGIKMKLSVIMGIVHMMIGIFIKGTNTIYFRRLPEFFTEVVTGVIILFALFGWMDVLIVAKWFLHIDLMDNSAAPNGQMVKMPGLDSNRESENLLAKSKGDWENEGAPSIINLLIGMIMSPGTDSTEGKRPLVGTTDQQITIGTILLALYVGLIPVMLLVKPCCFRGGSHKDEQDEIEFTNINRMEGDMQ